jgi:hypothetical protein
VSDKWLCDECHWKGLESDILRGYNPFLPEETIYGCPTCKSIDSFTNIEEKTDERF